MTVDSVTLEILRNYFQAVVEDMARVVERTSFTTFVKETADFSTGLIAPSGEYVAYPWRLGALPFLGINMKKAIDYTPHYDEGDILIMNDPYTTGALCTHLPDIHLLKPIFSGGEIIAFAYAFIHSSDIGGTVPASVWPRARELFQEGLRLRPTKLFRAGVPNQDILNVFADNSRIPEMNWGDIKAMVAALNTCERRLHAMVDKFGRDVVTGAMVDLLDHVAERSRAALATIPDGTYRFVDYVEDDMVSDVPIRIEVALTARGGHVDLDYTGTDPQVSAALNVPSDGGPHPFMCQTLFCYIFTQDRDIPKSGSVIRPITMTLPRGTVVNPEFPGACGVRFGTALRLSDAVLGALAQAVPGKVPAASAGAISPVVCSLMNPATGRRHVTVVEPMIGGGGAGAEMDGVHGCDPTHGFLRNTPVESIEADVPIVMRRYDLIPDSGGAGRHRAGMAIRMDFQVFHPDAIVTARGQERFKIQPWGVGGGACGTAGATIVNPEGPAPRDIGKIDYLPLRPGDVVSIRAPAGGGHGDPLERDPELVATDVRAGLVGPAAARDAYGVVLRAGGVDPEATAARRAELRGTRGAGNGAFDYGPFRRALEARWPVEVSGECARLANTLPTPVRDYAKHRMYEAVQEVARTRRPELADVQAAWEAVQADLRRALTQGV
jgi:N-methylhydantoinase B